jgi:CRISPR-associated endoribonuclease Cas6
VELDHLPFEILAVSPVESAGESQPDAAPAPDPWTGRTSYQELSAPYLLARVEAPRQVSLHFASPTAFKSADQHQPLPLPELVFGSLLQRWNDYAPIVFPPEVRRYCAECLAISRFNLKSRVAPLKSGAKRIGGVGEVTYTSLNYDRYWMSVVHTLAEFCLYAGVGVSASQGLGQARAVREGTRSPGRTFAGDE